MNRYITPLEKFPLRPIEVFKSLQFRMYFYCFNKIITCLFGSKYLKYIACPHKKSAYQETDVY